MSASSLPPWDLLSFTFSWDSSITSTISQCSIVTLDYQGTVNGRVANPSPTPPYNLVLYSSGFEPWMISMNNSATTGRTQWLANLPTEPTFVVTMKDSRGYSGGILHTTLKMTPGAGCNLASPLKASSLDVSVNGSSPQCQKVLVTVTNGYPPYTLKFIPQGHPTAKTMHFALSPFSFTLDVSAGTEYWLIVHDSRGSSAAKGPYQIGSSSDDSCLGVATTVAAGRFTTVYSGGTTRPTEGGAETESGSYLGGFRIDYDGGAHPALYTYSCLRAPMAVLKALSQV